MWNVSIHHLPSPRWASQISHLYDGTDIRGSWGFLPLSLGFKISKQATSRSKHSEVYLYDYEQNNNNNNQKQKWKQNKKSSVDISKLSAHNQEISLYQFFTYLILVNSPLPTPLPHWPTHTRVSLCSSAPSSPLPVLYHMCSTTLSHPSPSIFFISCQGLLYSFWACFQTYPHINACVTVRT